jgi:hypothetical protein
MPGALLSHYTKLATALEHVLLDGRIRLSPLSAMRDPRESRDWLPSHGTAEGVEWEPGIYENLHTELQAARSRIKVFSLTETLPEVDPDGMDETGFGYAHPRLWEQYAEDHRGVCLVFDQEALLGQLAAQFDTLVGSVDYTDDDLIPGVTSATVAKRGVEGAVKYLIESRLRELVFRKTTDWSTEVEFRIATITDDSDYLYARVLESVRAVIVGVAMPHVYLPSLRALCDPFGIAVQQMFWQNGLPWLWGSAPPFPSDPDASATVHVKVRTRAGNPEEW